MTREKMLEKAQTWVVAAEDRHDDVSTCLRIAEMWIRLAAEVRKGSVPASPDVN